MRVQSGAVGVFVPGHWTVPENPITGGMGDFVGGSFVVPQNPVGIGDFVLGRFTVPQNPILDALNMQRNADGSYGPGLAGSDCGCGCGGHPSECAGGLGDLMDDAMNFVNGQVAKIQAGDMVTIATWAGGALLVYFLLSRGSGYRSAAKELRAKQRAELARLRAQFPTGARRF